MQFPSPKGFISVVYCEVYLFFKRLSLINNKNDSKSSDELDRSYENKCCSEPAKDFIDLPSVALTERKHSCRENAVGLINTNLNSISLGPITPRTHSPGMVKVRQAIKC